MANIDLQRKEGPGVWPWLIGALALVLVIWAVVEFTGTDMTPGTADPAAEEAPLEAYPPPATDPYAPPATDPTAPPAADPYAPPVPGTDPTEIQRETPGTPRNPAPPTGGQPNGA